MIPGHLAIVAWVFGGGGLVSDDTGFGQLFMLITVVPVLLILLSVSTVQAVWTARSVHSPLFTSRQAGLQLGLWASLAAVGAGVTMESLNGGPFSAVLRLFPGAVGASQAVAWVGVAGFLVAYVALLVSLRARRAPGPGAGRDLVGWL